MAIGFAQARQHAWQHVGDDGRNGPQPQYARQGLAESAREFRQVLKLFEDPASALYRLDAGRREDDASLSAVNERCFEDVFKFKLWNGAPLLSAEGVVSSDN